MIDPYHFYSVLNGLLLLKMIKDIHPKDFEWKPYPTNANPTGENHLSLLLGIENAESLFDLPLKDWLTHIVQSLKVTQWENEMKPFLLYQ